MDDGQWQKEPVFSGLLPNSTHSFYQRVAETVTDKVSDSSSALLVATDKADNPTIPTQPKVQSKTATSVTLQAVFGCEYGNGGSNWQDDPTFNNLQPGHTYNFYQRVAETSTTKASAASPVLSVTTEKAENPTTPAQPNLQSKTDTSVTLQTVLGYEYSNGGESWQDDPTFNNLQPGHTYNFYQRVAETDTANASSASSALTVTTDKSTVAAPAQPKVESKTQTSVTLQTVPGCEYSRDGEHWQSSPTFDNLQPNQEYTFYQRYKETETTKASEKSAPLTVKTDPAYLLGDLNGDGKVTNADAIYLLQHTFFPEDYPVNQPCDFNGDGKVTNADAIYLLQYTFFPEDYPLYYDNRKER